MIEIEAGGEKENRWTGPLKTMGACLFIYFYVPSKKHSRPMIQFPH